MQDKEQSDTGELVVQEMQDASKTAPALLEKQTEALANIGNSLNAISNWITGGGLTSVLSGYARSQAVKDILGGLASHSGRDALDARLVNQNALEIVKHVEAVFDKYATELKAKNDGGMDPDLHNAEDAYSRWKEAQIKKEKEKA